MSAQEDFAQTAQIVLAVQNLVIPQYVLKAIQTESRRG
jgi:hypothetical protein